MEDTLEKILAKVEKIDSIEGRLDQMDSKFDEVAQRVDQMDSRFDKVDQRLERMDSRFDKVDQRFELIDNSFKQVNKDISHIKSQQKENTAILRALEHAGEIHKAELDNLNTNVAKLSGKTERVQSRAEAALNNSAINRLDIVELQRKN